MIVSADAFEGDTTFQPIRQRVKITLVANLNHVRVEENAIVKPSPRRGTERTDGRVQSLKLFSESQVDQHAPRMVVLAFEIFLEVSAA